MRTDLHTDHISYESIETTFPSLPGMEGCGAVVINSIGSTLDSPPHWHHALELVLVMEGSCRYTINSAEYLTTAGDLQLINSQYIHSALNGDPYGYVSSLVVEISDSYLRKMTASESRYEFFIEKGSEAYLQIREDLYAIANAIRQKDEFINFLISSRLNHILLLLHTHCCSHETHNLNGYSKDIIRYVSEHYMEPLTVEDAAQFVGLQKQYFCRRFHQETGLSFKYYLNRIRLDIALSLLATGSYSVMEAAINVGYSSDKMFLNWCKKIYHLTPTQYVSIYGGLSPDRSQIISSL